MRAASWGWVSIVLLAFGCATAADVDDNGTQNFGGSPSDGGPDVKVDGKVDNPNGGGTGSTSAGGTSAGGTSAGGSESGGTSAGGTSAGGTSAGGTSAGGTGSGGSGGSGSGGTGGTCGAGQKKCASLCILPGPANGCTLVDGSCTACSPPANATAICTGNLCDFQCNAGYTKSGSSCVSGGGGGAPGGGGSTGTGGTSGCPSPCDATDSQAQAICVGLCALQGKFGACVPGLNCCICS